MAWWVDVIAEGPTGHGSRFVENPAVHRLLRSIQKFLEFRKEQETIFHTFTCECGKTLGDLVTLNLTKLDTNIGDQYKGLFPLLWSVVDLYQCLRAPGLPSACASNPPK